MRVELVNCCYGSWGRGIEYKIQIHTFIQFSLKTACAYAFAFACISALTLKSSILSTAILRVLSYDLAPPMNPELCTNTISGIPETEINSFISLMPLHASFNPIRRSKEPKPKNEPLKLIKGCNQPNKINRLPQFSGIPCTLHAFFSSDSGNSRNLIYFSSPIVFSSSSRCSFQGTGVCNTTIDPDGCTVDLASTAFLTSSLAG